MKSNHEIPKPLVDAIKAGNCVAFVGSGFSAAAEFPNWKDLLSQIALDLWPETGITGHGTLAKILGPNARPSSRELEMAAQFLFDKAEPNKDQSGRFHSLLKARLTHTEPLPSVMAARLKNLLGIPFRAIITTNFDTLLKGRSPSPETYLELLRPKRNAGWSDLSVAASLSNSRLTYSDSALIVQLHGSLHEENLDSLVFTRAQYRSRLYANPSYLTALRALLATSPVLFLGYSLTDAYLNELRAEWVEAFAKGGSTESPLAWAVLEDVSDDSKDYFLEHEGLGVISFDSKNGTNFSEFDELLACINELTNPVQRLKAGIKSKRILWLDPNPQNNGVARDLLRAANTGLSDYLVEVDTLEQAYRELETGTPGFDLVISHWGHNPQSDSNGLQLLRTISRLRSEGKVLPPVVIFANPWSRKPDISVHNRRQALQSGAVAYVTEWKSLMETIESLLGDIPC